MGKLILVTGGARSGKSIFAEKMAKELGENILYMATAIAFDDEMKDRIKKHKSSRPSNWITWEGFRNLGDELTIESPKYDGILIDCITIMVTNIMLSHSELNFAEISIDEINTIEEDIKNEINNLIKGAKSSDCDVIMVTNELGSGIVPENPMARVFRDFAGRANQMLGNASDEIYLTVCGAQLRIK